MLVLLVASVGVAFVIIYHETSNRLSAQINRDLKADTTQLEQSLLIFRDDGDARVLTSARQYVRAQPFRSISTLLFVLVPGQAPISNYPELFQQSNSEEHESASFQAGENRLAAALKRPLLDTEDRQVADVGRIRIRERSLSLGSLRLTIGAGEPLASLARAQRGVVHSFLLAGLFITLAVLLGSYLIGSRVTAPLRRMARVAARIDAGDLEPRMEEPARRGDEVAVLAASFNHMLQRLQDGFRIQREFIADASHELRTPLTVIQGQLEVLANRRAVDTTEVRRVERLVSGEIARMRRIVDDLLLLAQTERPDFLKLEEVQLGPFITEIWDGASLIAERRFELGPVVTGWLVADPDRLAQAIRNLINNAIDHTDPGTGLIRLSARGLAPDSVVIELLDDGPGVPAEQLQRIFHRFHRADSARGAAEGAFGGAGLGLSIVRAIAEAHGGQARAFNREGTAGASFELVLPGFRPSPSGPSERSFCLSI